MKTRNLYYAMALVAGTMATSNVASAQDVFVDEATTVTEFTCDNSNHYFQSWRDNWFIEVGAGANQPLVETTGHSVNGKKWTASYSVGFGHWFSPYLGLRFKAIGGALHWNYAAPGQEEIPSQADLTWTRSRHVSLTMELMWDMFNSLGGVNPDRVFSIIPFVGVGGDCNWNYKNGIGEKPYATNILREFSTHKKSVQWTLPVVAGIQFRFRLCKYVDFFAEARATFYGDNWDNTAVGRSIDCLVSAMGGFNFNIGGRGWNKFNECAYVSQIAALNGQVNDLRAQLLACGQTVAALQAQLPCPEQVEKECNNAPLMATVRFLLNSYEILPTEQVNIYTMAEWLKANPNEKIVIAGYADRDTGTSEYNMKLSEERANVVKDALVNDYGINPNRLKIEYFGSDVQEYPSHNDWNRIVIFKQ